MKTFKHSGDIGDLIYALPTLRALGGGMLYLGKSDFTRVRTSALTLANLGPLLVTQPYIEGVALWSGEQGLTFDYDLDHWRDGWDTKDNIAEQHLKTFGLPVSELDKPWLEVAPQEFCDSVPITVINRTARHQNPLFPWNDLVKENPGVYFVGSKDEHGEFEKRFGYVRHWITQTLLDLARAIAGCQLFIGNQSAAYAIAEGLKKPVIQEVYLPTPNCIFKRPGAQFVTGSEIELPELG